jgi:hypothetical protein
MRERKRVCDLLRESEESGNIASSISVLLLEAAWPLEQQGDASMKTILAGVVLAALMASPLFAQSQTNDGLSDSRTYPEQKKRLGAAYRGLDGAAWNSTQPTSNADPKKQGLCSTAPGFCPNYHGGNGG